MNKIYSFGFSKDLSLVKSDRGYFIRREDDDTLFEISDNYKSDTPNAYLSANRKYMIEKELRNSAPSLFLEVFNIKGENNVDVDQVVEKALSRSLDMIKQVQHHNPYEEAIIQAIMEKGKHITQEQLVVGMSDKIEEYISREYGTLPRRIEITRPDREPKKMSGIFHETFDTILKLTDANIPVLLVGGAGTGKNHTLEQISDALDIDFYFSNAVTQEHKITGYKDAHGIYHETQFYKAFSEGGLFFLDEMDASVPEVLLILNSAIANKYFDFPNGRVDAHEDFRVVAASNTFGTGADNLYVGRNQLDAATLDRFAVIEFDYDDNVEKQLADGDMELFDFIKNMRSTIQSNGVRYTVSMRATINARKVSDILPLETVIKSIILKGMDVSDIEVIKNNMSDQGGRYMKKFREMGV